MKTLINTKANHFKEYRLWIERRGPNRFVVRFAYGRIGTNLKTGTKAVVRTARDGKLVRDRVMCSKLRRGYVALKFQTRVVARPINT